MEYKKNSRQEKLKPKKISEIVMEENKRFSSGYEEFDRILGNTGTYKGFVIGQVVLLSGEPGVGKSTILLQLLGNQASAGLKSLYISAEESESQVAQRAERILVNGSGLEEDENLKLVAAHNIEGMISLFQSEKPQFVVIDSIQTVYSEDSQSLPGSVSQVKVCANKLVNYAKANGITMIIVGHINKEGNIAGPKILEHLVDSVFQLEGNEVTGVRMLRSIKNRFGPTMEMGMFKMDENGMQDLSDPFELFNISDDENSVGVCRSVIVEGQRPLVVEVQALTNSTPFSLPKRVSEGIHVSRVQRIAAIISKYSRNSFAEKDIYVKIAGGMKVVDPSLDLAVAMAILSSVKGKKLKKGTVAMGELNLTGGISFVSRLKNRMDEARRVGYKNIVSSQVYKSISEAVKGEF